VSNPWPVRVAYEPLPANGGGSQAVVVTILNHEQNLKIELNKKKLFLFLFFICMKDQSVNN